MGRKREMCSLDLQGTHPTWPLLQHPPRFVDFGNQKRSVEHFSKIILKQTLPRSRVYSHVRVRCIPPVLRYWEYPRWRRHQTMMGIDTPVVHVDTYLHSIYSIPWMGAVWVDTGNWEGVDGKTRTPEHSFRP